MLSREKIEKLLEEDDRARECDNWYLIQAWRLENSKIYVRYENLPFMSNATDLLKAKNEILSQGIKAKEPEKKPEPKAESKVKDKPKGTKIKG